SAPDLRATLLHANQRKRTRPCDQQEDGRGVGGGAGGAERSGPRCSSHAHVGAGVNRQSALTAFVGQSTDIPAQQAVASSESEPAYRVTHALPQHLTGWQLPPDWHWGAEGVAADLRHYQEVIDALGRS